MTAIERRQYILETLSDRRSISVGNLAKECNVSIRTIKYDIESLSSSVPILTVPDPGGGIRVADGWYLSRRYLREDQEALLRELLPELSPDRQDTLKSILVSFAKPKVKKPG